MHNNAKNKVGGSSRSHFRPLLVRDRPRLQTSRLPSSGKVTRGSLLVACLRVKNTDSGLLDRTNLRQRYPAQQASPFVLGVHRDGSVIGRNTVVRVGS